MTTTDPSRSPAGTESLWAYTHVPQQVRGDAGGDADRALGRRRGASGSPTGCRPGSRRTRPGFGARVLARRMLAPAELERRDANLVGGAVNGGTLSLDQQLIFRPVPGTGRSETPVRGLYLASASAHPGGGVHGACGANAARAALFWNRSPRRGSGADLAG